MNENIINRKVNEPERINENKNNKKNSQIFLKSITGNLRTAGCKVNLSIFIKNDSSLLYYYKVHVLMS